MTKRDWIWVAVRVFGLYLLVMAIVAIPQTIGAGIQWWITYDPGPKADSDKLYDMTNMLSKSHLGIFIAGIVRLIGLGLAGVYFLKGARAVCRLIAPPDFDQDRSSSAPTTTEPPQ